MSDEFDELLPQDDELRSEESYNRPPRPKGKKFLGKFLFFLLILAALFLGFVFIQQTLLDLEARAQMYATQTAAFLIKPLEFTQVRTSSESTLTPTPSETSTPLPPTTTPTLNSDARHTATIAALLTQSTQ